MPLAVPILRATNSDTGSELYYFDYRANQVITNLQKVTSTEVTQAKMKDLYDQHFPITGLSFTPLAGNNTTFAPLMERKVPLKMHQTVQGQATLTPDKVAAALTRHSVTNIIGTAMQRIPTNHQGDIMLSDNV